MENNKWSLNNASPLTNQVIIVTGGNTGLGYEASLAFARLQGIVIIACRLVQRGEDAKQKILQAYPKAVVDVMQLDLASLSSIKTFVTSFKIKYKRLDILLNNAGIMTVPYGKTEDGFELQNGVNHLGHFALTSQLFDLLKSTKKSRVVNVSSAAHKVGKMDFKNYLFEQGNYSKMGSYGRSKLSNLLFTYELARKVKTSNIDIKVLAAHPGVANTELFRYMKKGSFLGLFFGLFKKIASTPEEGALPEIRACLDPNALNGQYYGPGKGKRSKKLPVVVQSSRASHSEKDAKQLWVLSEQLTQISFEVK
jgi:NAD(P)-dependent dehydrogenase (short-subunit alcohol dehydrogenase family)